MQKVSCIIPAYNEGDRIQGVLSAVYNHPYVSELIVIDDGSSDQTKDVVGRFGGVKLIVHTKNEGKSQSVVDGVEASHEETLFFLDADLIGLTPENISRLIEPIFSSRADMAISLIKNAPWHYRKIGLNFISGQRVLYKKLLAGHLDDIRKLPGFGLEVYLNNLIIKNRYRIKVVFWENVISPWKYKKVGLWAGLKGELIMNSQILKVVSIFGALRQIIKMLSLKVK